MKSIIAFALLALVSTAASAKGDKHLRAPLAPAADATPDPELTDDDIRTQVRAYLGSIDTPVGANRWKALGPRAEAALMDELNGATLPTYRARTLDGLAAIGSKNVALFKTIAGDENEAYVVRSSALHGIAMVLPKTEAAAQLKTLLEQAKDTRVRAEAGLVLALTGPENCTAVRKQINREEATARLRYGRAMDACFGQP